MIYGERKFITDIEPITSVEEQEMCDFIDNVFLEGFSEEIFYEYAGNSQKNKEFAECLQLLDQGLNSFVTNMKVAGKCIEKMIALCNTINSKNAGKVWVEIQDVSTKSWAEVKKNRQFSGAGNMWKSFDSKIKKFNNKYSEFGMNARLRMAKKVENYLKDCDDILAKYCSEEFVKRIAAAKDKATVANVTVGDGFGKLSASCYNWLADEWKYTVGDLRYVMKALNINAKDNNIIFKILNKNYQADLNSSAKKALKESYVTSDELIDFLTEDYEFLDEAGTKAENKQEINKTIMVISKYLSEVSGTQPKIDYLAGLFSNTSKYIRGKGNQFTLEVRSISDINNNSSRQAKKSLGYAAGYMLGGTKVGQIGSLATGLAVPKSNEGIQSLYQAAISGSNKIEKDIENALKKKVSIAVQSIADSFFRIDVLVSNQ